MKKNLLSMFAVAAGLLMATSCSTKQEDEVTVGGEAVVTFTAQLPSGLGSRAPQKTTGDGETTTTTATFGKGTKATRLQYAVYKVTENAENGDKWELISELSKETTLTNLTATVSLQLVNGNTYAVAFWADASTTNTQNPIYSFNKTDCKITVDYTTKVPSSSDESLDAFYAVTEPFKVNGSAQQNIDLKRPFAQLNIGTADLTAYTKANSGKEVKQAGIKVKVQNILNLKNGELEGDATEVTFALANLPSTEKFPVDNYSYLTMNYLLMPSDKQADNEVTIIYDEESGAQERTFTNVPLQRNYRTNIYGNLLTSMTTFNVEIKPAFAGIDTVYVWDGAETIEPTEVDGAYIITNAAEWAWLGEQESINKNITLTKDIDFNGYSVQTINLVRDDIAYLSNGMTFDGQNHTLSNVKTLATKYHTSDGKPSDSDGHYANSLFTVAFWAKGVTIKDLKVKDIKVDCPHSDNAGNICGYAAAICAAVCTDYGLTISNVHVDRADVKGVQSVGAIVGNVSVGSVTLTGCSVKNSKLSNYEIKGESGFVATLVGRVRSTASLTNCKVLTGNTVDAWYAEKESRGINSIDAVAAVDAKNGGKLTIDDATKNTGTSENVTVTKHKIE